MYWMLIHTPFLTSDKLYHDNVQGEIFKLPGQRTSRYAVNNLIDYAGEPPMQIRGYMSRLSRGIFCEYNTLNGTW